MLKSEKEGTASEIDRTEKDFLSKSDLTKAIIWEAYFHRLRREKFYANKFREKYGGSYGSIWPRFESLLGDWLICTESPKGRKLGKTWRMKENRYLGFKNYFKKWGKKYIGEIIEASKYTEILHIAYLIFKKMSEKPMTVDELEKYLMEDFQPHVSNRELMRMVEFVLRLFHNCVKADFSGGRGGTFYYSIEKEKLPILASNKWRCKFYLKDGGSVTRNFFYDPRTNVPIFPISGAESKMELKARSLGINTKLGVPETLLDFPWVLSQGENATNKFPSVCQDCKGHYSSIPEKIVSSVNIQIEGKQAQNVEISEHAGEGISKFESCRRGIMALKNRIKEATGRDDVMIFWECPKGKYYFEISRRMFIPTVFRQIANP